MSFRPVRMSLLLALAAILISCGDQSFFMSLQGNSSDLEITSATDGQMFAKGASVPLYISAQDTSKQRDMEIEVTLTSTTGDVPFSQKFAATLNQQTSFALPADLPAGYYRLDIVLYSAGEVVQKKSSSFFVTGDGWKIVGITSFPPLITTKASVMLKAELQYPADADPYLRWTWKGKPIAKGASSAGYGQVLWVAPSDEGVYTITLEVFPSAPAAGTDFPFTSSLALSTDIFVSGAGAHGTGDLIPESSYLSLLHLQATLADVGTGARKNGELTAVPVGKPQIVSAEDGFGYRLDGTTGIQLSWLALPVNNGLLAPFTVSMGLSFDDPTSAGRVFSALSTDGGFSLEIALDASMGGLRGILSGAGLPAFTIPWTGSALTPGQRSLISLSIIPQGTMVTAQWFLDGLQVSTVTATLPLSSLKAIGTVTVGGEGGFKGVIDELAIYTQDAAGRPTPDPDQFKRAKTASLGANLVLADGFDGLFLSTGFVLEGAGQLAAGTLTLKPGSALDLPPVPDSGCTVTADLAPGSVRSATLLVQWEGSSQERTAVPLTADAMGLSFSIAEDGLSIITGAGSTEKTIQLPQPLQKGANLLLSIANPGDAKAPLMLLQVQAVKGGK